MRALRQNGVWHWVHFLMTSVCENFFFFLFVTWLVTVLYVFHFLPDMSPPSLIVWVCFQVKLKDFLVTAPTRVLWVMGCCQNLGGLFMLLSNTPSRGSWIEVITWHQQLCESYSKGGTFHAVKHTPIWYLWKDFCEKAGQWSSSTTASLCRVRLSLFLPAVGLKQGEDKH